jgi:hypothetical protein
MSRDSVFHPWFCPLDPIPTRASSTYVYGQVFWLPDQLTRRPSHPNGQWLYRLSSPVTAAGPQRIFTVFPLLSP